GGVAGRAVEIKPRRAADLDLLRPVDAATHEHLPLRVAVDEGRSRQHQPWVPGRGVTRMARVEDPVLDGENGHAGLAAGDQPRRPDSLLREEDRPGLDLADEALDARQHLDV